MVETLLSGDISFIRDNVAGMETQEEMEHKDSRVHQANSEMLENQARKEEGYLLCSFSI